jgi:carboxylesterase type B
MESRVLTYLPSLKAEVVGKLQGSGSGIALFRGIPYATLEKRWTQSKICHQLESRFDATGYGPRCPQRQSAGLMTGSVPDPLPGDDEFRCLNLNIAVPGDILRQSKGSASVALVPVLVWIHG